MPVILRRKKQLPSAIVLTDAHRTVDYATLLHRWRRRHLLFMIRHWQATTQATLLQSLRPHKARYQFFSVSGQPQLAVRYRLQHLHLPEQRLRQRGTLNLPLLRRRFCITTAAHSIAAVHRANRANVDAVLLSPVFPTQSHAAITPTLGVYGYRRLQRATPLPAYPLGGITPKTLRLLQHATQKKRVAGLVFFLQK